MHRTLALVLAGGEGRRLAPLTRERSKPAVYFGGSYRLIDFVLSNLVNSGVRYIKVVTQYRATSLVRHLARNWPTTTSSMGHEIDLVPATMNHGPTWFRGTADAIWQNLDVLREQRPEDVLIFGSDHIYKMDVSLMVEDHRATRSDVTVAVLPMPRSEAQAFGCVRVDDDGYVTGFLEKPQEPPAMPGHPELSLISMGNYVFKTPALLDELRRCMGRDSVSYDFGKDILATAHHRLKVRAYDFREQLCPGEAERARGYWRDVGTLDSYYEASMDLVSVEPHLNLYNDAWPIRGAHLSCGPAKFVFSDEAGSRVGTARDSIVGAGAILSGARLEQSIAFEKVRMHSFSDVRRSVLFPAAEIGRHCHLERCIVDREVKVPPHTVVGVDAEEDRRRGFTVSEGGVVVLTRANFGQVDEFDIAPPPQGEPDAAH